MDTYNLRALACENARFKLCSCDGGTGVVDMSFPCLSTSSSLAHSVLTDVLVRVPNVTHRDNSRSNAVCPIVIGAKCEVDY